MPQILSLRRRRHTCAEPQSILPRQRNGALAADEKSETGLQRPQNLAFFLARNAATPVR